MKFTFLVAASTSKDKHANGQLLIWQNFLNNSLIRQNFLNFLIGQNQIRTFSSSWIKFISAVNRSTFRRSTRPDKTSGH